MRFALPRFVPFAIALAASVFGCARSQPYRDMDGSVDAAVDGGRVGRRDAASTDGGYLYDVYVDPGCDGAPPIDAAIARVCDPYASGECPDGQACYPYAIYPEGSCGDELFGTECAPAGGGLQGDHCTSTLDCAGGFACFITGEGNQCKQLCNQDGSGRPCPRGLICGWTDLADYGVCT